MTLSFLATSAVQFMQTSKPVGEWSDEQREEFVERLKPLVELYHEVEKSVSV